MLSLNLLSVKNFHPVSFTPRLAQHIFAFKLMMAEEKEKSLRKKFILLSRRRRATLSRRLEGENGLKAAASRARRANAMKNLFFICADSDTEGERLQPSSISTQQQSERVKTARKRGGEKSV